MDFTDDDLRTLGDKLDAMDLTDGERAALVAVFDAAAPEGDEVAGFAYDLNPNDLSFKAGAELSSKIRSFGSTTGDGPSGFIVPKGFGSTTGEAPNGF